MLLTTLATLGSIGASVYGGIKASQAANKASNILGNFREQRRRWYAAEQARDYTSRADVQSLLTKQKDLLTDNYRRSRATNIVAGGTDASLALQRDAANRVTSNTLSSIAAQGARYKDAVASEGRNVDSALQQQQIGIQQQKATNIASAAGQASKAMAGIAAGDTYSLGGDLAVFGIGKKKKGGIV